ncbi:hypothetical protein ACFT2C_04335 [Promicromonospora sp. NPDC057138]|uniref:hypothetical protein n=1 Tax=Promicromonospora sp. NPDC057138 TaxID=3346031 RepID=UPI00363FBEB2
MNPHATTNAIALPRTAARTETPPVNALPMNTGSGAGEGSLRLEIVFAKPESIASLGAHVVGPNLDVACALGQGSWWFLRREDGWHLHLDRAGRRHVPLSLNKLVERGVVQYWTQDTSCQSSSGSEHEARPEPGTGFGAVSCAGIGPGSGLDLHRADSRGSLAYLRQLHPMPEASRPLLRTRHVVGVLARAVCRAAGLDHATAADVLDTLARRSAGGLDESSRFRAHGLAEVLTLLWRVPVSKALGSSITPWATDLAMAARSLAAATRDGDLPAAEHAPYLQGQLARGLAAQWDRLGLPATDQTILAVATRDALRTTRRAS